MPELTAEFEREGCIRGELKYLKHELIPSFLIDKPFIDELGNEVDVERTYYTEKLLGNLYARMDSTARNEEYQKADISEMNGDEIREKRVFSGRFPTYSSSMNQDRQKVWAEQYELFTVDQIRELRRLENMTPEEYKEDVREKLEKASKLEYYEFKFPVKGKVLTFRMAESDRVDFIGQMVMGKKSFEVHDMYRENKEDYSSTEVQGIVAMLEYVTKLHKYPYDIYIARLNDLPEGYTKEDVDAASGPPRTEEEQAWMDGKLAPLRAALGI